MFAAHVAVHGGACRDFGATQVAALSLHLLMGQLHVFLQHILRHILLVTDGARKRLSNCMNKLVRLHCVSLTKRLPTQFTHEVLCARVSFVMLQHVNFLGKFAVALFAFVFFNSFVQLHMMP